MQKTASICLTAFIFSFLIISCKDSSTNSGEPFIEITNAATTLFALNDDGCDFGDSGVGSAFLFEIDVDASSDIEIDGVEFDISFVDGAEIPNRFTNDFDLTDDGLEFIWCFRFEETGGVELDLKILANNESIESNVVSINIERPDGANKVSVDSDSR